MGCSTAQTLSRIVTARAALCHSWDGHRQAPVKWNLSKQRSYSSHLRSNGIRVGADVVFNLGKIRQEIGRSKTDHHGLLSLGLKDRLQQSRRGVWNGNGIHGCSAFFPYSAARDRN